MPTSNEQFRDGMIRHQIGLLRLSQRLRRELIDILNDTEDQFAGTLLRRLEKLVNRNGVDVSDKRIAKVLDELEDRIKEIRWPAFEKMRDSMRNELGEVMEQESNFMALLFAASLPVVVETKKINLRSAKALLTTQRMRGPGRGMATLNRWFEGIFSADISRAMAEVRTGLTEGRTARQIVRSIVGSSLLGARDGTTQLTRNAIQLLNRTAVIHFSTQARRLWLSENQSAFLQEIFTAVLDSKTTPICRSLDGEIYDIGEGPHPPLHPGCRSLRVSYIDSIWASTRPMKPTTERMLLREFSEETGVKVVSSRDKLPHGYKLRFDDFSRKRVRELVGEIPARINYSEWLPTQPRSFIEDVLGKTKARLFLDGKLSLKRFVDESGEEYTLEELAIRDRQAFIDAGLDPQDFLE